MSPRGTSTGWIRRLTVGSRTIGGQLAADATVFLTLFLTVFLSGVLVVATPRLFDLLSNEAVDETVAGAAPVLRNISVQRTARLGSGPADDPLAIVRGVGEQFEASEMPETLQGLIGGRTYVVDSPRFSVSRISGDEPVPYTRFMRLRHQSEIQDHILLVEGSFPEPREPASIQLGDGCADSSCETELPLYEVALTEETLDELRLEVGDRVLLAPDESDVAFGDLPRADLEYRLMLEVSGIVEPIEPRDTYWSVDRALLTPRLVDAVNFTIVYAVGLMSPDAYPSLLAETGSAHWLYTWRFLTDFEGLEASSMDRLAADVTSLESNFSSVAPAGSPNFTLSTGLGGMINGFLEQRSLTVSMLSMSLLGVLVVAMATILLLSGLVSERQRSAFILLKSRGSSPAQLGLSRALQGVMICLPAAGLAYVTGLALTPDAAAPWSLVGIVLLSAVTVSFVAATGLPLAYAELGHLDRDLRAPSRPSSRRLVAEALVVVVALTAVLLLRRRGEAGVVETAGATFDPLLALAPVLLGLAVGIATMRLYAYPVRLLGWIGSKGRGLSLFIGFKRILQQRDAARLPLIVILLGIGVAVFSSVLRISITEGQLDSSWHQVGADHLIAGGSPGVPLSPLVDLSGVEEIEATANAARVPGVGVIRDGSPSSGSVELLALETNGYQAVTTGTRAYRALPETLLGPNPPGAIGTDLAPIPAIVSSSWATTDLMIGERLTLDLGTVRPVFEVTEIVDVFPTLPLNRPFLIASLDHLDAVDGLREFERTLVFVRAAEDVRGQIEATIDGQTRSNPRIISQGEVFEELHHAPFARGVDRGLLGALAIGGAFALVAAISSIALTFRDRRRDFGYLRTLGISGRDAMRLTIIEQLPPLAVATTVGSLFGVAMVLVLEPALDLVALTGPDLPAAIRIDPLAIMWIALGMGAALVFAVVIFGYINRNENLGELLRVGYE